jgi:hypothetical protein
MRMDGAGIPDIERTRIPARSKRAMIPHKARTNVIIVSILLRVPEFYSEFQRISRGVVQQKSLDF